MTDRSCPSCGTNVASHQTLCHVCRTPVPSEAGPVGTPGSESGIVFGAPPPRQRRLAEQALEPPSVADPGGLDDPTRIDPSIAAPTSSSADAPLASRARLGPDPTRVDPAVGEATTRHAGDATSQEGGAAPASHAAPTPSAPPHYPAPGYTAPGYTGVEPQPYGPSAGTLGVPGAASLDERGNLPGGALALVAGALAVAGVFLPWVEIAGSTVSGWSASQDAKAVLALAGAATVVGALLVGGARSLALRVGLVVVAVALAVLTVVEIISVGNLDGDPSMGTGLYLLLAAGVVAALAAVLTRHKRFR